MRCRVIGICFGHQVVGRALGATVAKSEKGWEISITKLSLNEKGKKVFGVEELVRLSYLLLEFASEWIGFILRLTCHASSN
jgi:GMP synthase-like glutamine amidotransferase